MKIAIDARFYGLENAGLGRYTIKIVKNLSKIDSDNQYYILLRKKYFNSLKLPKNWHKILADYQHYSFAEQINVPKIIKKISPDITHYLHFNVPIFSPRFYIVTIHDMIMHHSKGVNATTLPVYQYLFRRIGYKLVFKNAIKRAEKILVPSESVKNELIGYFKTMSEKVAVTYLGINNSFFYDGQKLKSKDYFLYVGSAYPHKNLIRLIKAVKITKQKLIIVTSRGVFQKRLRAVIEKLSAYKNVEILSYVNDKKLIDLYKKAVAFVYPSLFEGFGFQGLEAMASKTLLVASNIPVFNEIYKDNAIYFDPHSVESISKVLKQVKNIRDSEREKIVSKAYGYAKNFFWQNTAQKTLEIYETYKKF